MIYYFYSEKDNLRGLVNHRLVKDILFSDKRQAVEDALEKYADLRGRPVGYVYQCRKLTGNYFNNAYKTEHPVQITGCEKLEDLL